MSRAYRFLQASGGRCQQQRILLAQGSTSGMGQLLLRRPQETAFISSACCCSHHKRQEPAAPACEHAFTARHLVLKGGAAPAAQGCLQLCRGLVV